MNRVIGIGVVLVNAGFLINMGLFGRTATFNVVGAALYFFQAAFYLFSTYAGFQLMITSRR